MAMVTTAVALKKKLGLPIVALDIAGAEEVCVNDIKWYFEHVC